MYFNWSKIEDTKLGQKVCHWQVFKAAFCVSLEGLFAGFSGFNLKIKFIKTTRFGVICIIDRTLLHVDCCLMSEYIQKILYLTTYINFKLISVVCYLK